MPNLTISQAHETIDCYQSAVEALIDGIGKIAPDLTPTQGVVMSNAIKRARDAIQHGPLSAMRDDSGLGW